MSGSIARLRDGPRGCPLRLVSRRKTTLADPPIRCAFLGKTHKKDHALGRSMVSFRQACVSRAGPIGYALRRTQTAENTHLPAGRQVAQGRHQPIPPELRRLAERLESCRKRTRRPRRLPDGIWGAAAALAEAHGVSGVARALRLDYYALKRRASAAALSAHSHPNERRGLQEGPSGHRDTTGQWQRLRSPELRQESATTSRSNTDASSRTSEPPACAARRQACLCGKACHNEDELRISDRAGVSRFTFRVSRFTSCTETIKLGFNFCVRKTCGSTSGEF